MPSFFGFPSKKEPSAFAKEKTDEVKVECKCPPGNHYGHCNDQGSIKAIIRAASVNTRVLTPERQQA